VVVDVALEEELASDDSLLHVINRVYWGFYLKYPAAILCQAWTNVGRGLEVAQFLVQIRIDMALTIPNEMC
jgi:hypothetical protein